MEMEREKPQHSAQPKQIFILSGQSNMSGRGGVHNKHWDHRVPPESHSSPSILRFSAKSQWIIAQEPLHADIDVRKTCGIGPGMPFANSLPRSPSSVVGLVPCAVGGTAIAEWERGKRLYDQMIARAMAALEAGGGEIVAVLWYQGESDTDAKSKADDYRNKMEKLIADVRGDLGLPSLPFIQVALASGVDEELIQQVREAQLGIDMPNVACVDAMGLPLNADHLHLTTDAQVVLGKMLAQAYVTHFCQQGGATSFSSASRSFALPTCPSPSFIVTAEATCINVKPCLRTIYQQQGMEKRSSSCWNFLKRNACGSFEWQDPEACDHGKESALNLLHPISELRCKVEEVLPTKLLMQIQEQCIHSKWSSYWIFKMCLLLALALFLLSIVFLL